LEALVALEGRRATTTYLGMRSPFVILCGDEFTTAAAEGKVTAPDSPVP
jgi:hypothetical protein